MAPFYWDTAMMAMSGLLSSGCQLISTLRYRMLPLQNDEAGSREVELRFGRVKADRRLATLAERGPAPPHSVQKSLADNCQNDRPEPRLLRFTWLQRSETSTLRLTVE